MEKTLFIIAGANGSGKTTLAKVLTEKYNVEFVNADEIAKEIDPSNTTGGELSAGRIFFKNIMALLKKEKSMAIESTLSGLYFRNLIKKFKTAGYKINLVYIFLDTPTVCIERIKERVLQGGHYVPDTDVKRRYYRSKNNFWNIYKHLVDKWFLVSNSQLNFTEFCLGKGDDYIINDEDLFNNFMKDVEWTDESK